MPVYNKRGILLLPKVIVLNPKDGSVFRPITTTFPFVVSRKYFISPEMCANNPPFFPIPQFSSAAAIRFIYKSPCLFVYNLTTRRIITRSL